jgi:hypothetical protein
MTTIAGRFVVQADDHPDLFVAIVGTITSNGRQHALAAIWFWERWEQEAGQRRTVTCVKSPCGRRISAFLG